MSNSKKVDGLIKFVKSHKYTRKTFVRRDGRVRVRMC